jgi:GNAT superfamily N-acetyltransferase
MVTDEAVVLGALAQLERAGTVELRLWGTSMLPAIWPGARLCFEACEGSALRVGDIALVRRAGILVAHRVVEAGGRVIRTRGDARKALDAPVPREAVVARARGVVFALWTVAVPPPADSWINKMLVVSGPINRALTPALVRIARGTRSMLWERGVLARGRRRLTTREVRALRATDTELLRRYLLRRGERPTVDVLGEWMQRAVAEDQRVFVALACDGIVGHVQLELAEGLGLLRDIWEDRAWRGTGVAEALLDEATATARASGVELRVEQRPG